MGARRGHQLSDALDQLQRGEHQFARVLVGLQRLVVMGVAFAAAVDQIGAALLEPIHGEGRTGAVAQQALQPSAVRCLDTHPGIDRETAAVAAGRCKGGHVFGVTCLNVAARHEGAQDAFAHVGLHLAKSPLIKVCGCVKSYTVWLRLKHRIAHAHMY